MNAFVESLKRLYNSGTLNIDNIVKLYADKKITVDEKDYILQSA